MSVVVLLAAAMRVSLLIGGLACSPAREEPSATEEAAGRAEQPEKGTTDSNTASTATPERTDDANASPEQDTPEKESEEELVEAPALDYLAENPDRPVTSDELVEVLKALKPNANSNTLAGTLGAFGRRVANRYGMEDWPFDADWSFDHYSMVYVMAGWVAEKLRSFKAA